VVAFVIIVSELMSSPSTVATMPPDRKTQTLSDMPMTSGSSEEIMMIEWPLAANSRISE